MCVCMNVYVYVFMYVYMYVCMYVRVPRLDLSSLNKPDHAMQPVTIIYDNSHSGKNSAQR